MLDQQEVRGAQIAVEVVALMASPVHSYDGNPQDGPLPDPRPVGRQSIEVRAGLGIVGDRYFGADVRRRTAVTLMDAASLDHVQEELHLTEPIDPLRTRRNITLRGYAMDRLAAGRGPGNDRRLGKQFSLDTGSGPVAFQALAPASPCAWMDVGLHPGAFQALRSRGGIRALPLSSGTVSIGAGQLQIFGS
ncbi:hypothetical protein GCM10029976_032840 [Kribbella albertanoniae]